MRAAEPSPFGPGDPARPSLRYLFLRFLRYGLLAWGGPVAQIGLMHREVVERDGWMEETRFRKVLALYQALPGPEATELAVHFGHLKRGRAGGVAAGLGFVAPGLVLVTLLAALYVRFASTADAAQWLLYGARPATIALIVMALWRLGRRSLAGWDLALVGVGAALVGLLAPQVGFVLVLLLGGALVLGLRMREPAVRAAALLAPLALLAAFPALSPGGLAALAALSAKVGLLTFGGAYTAIPFLHQGAVVEHGWITQAQFLDALALAGLVPGPLIAVGTFVGYQAAGLAGAALASAIIFLPAFAFTLVGYPLFERLVHEPRLHAFLLGVTAAVIGLIAVSTVELARAAFPDVWTLLLGAGALVALARHAPIPAVLAASAACGAAILALT